MTETQGNTIERARIRVGPPKPKAGTGGMTGQFVWTVKEALDATPLAMLPYARYRSIDTATRKAVREATEHIVNDLPRDLMQHLDVRRVGKVRRYGLTLEGAELLGEWAVKRWAKDLRDETPPPALTDETTGQTVASLVFKEERDALLNQPDLNVSLVNTLGAQAVQVCAKLGMEIPWLDWDPMRLDERKLLKALLDHVLGK